MDVIQGVVLVGVVGVILGVALRRRPHAPPPQGGGGGGVAGDGSDDRDKLTL